MGVRRFMVRQFHLRSFAANLNAACTRLSVENWDFDDAQIAAIDTTLKDFHSTENSEIQASYSLPKFILDNILKFEKVGHTSRQILEETSHCLLGGAAVIAVLSIMVM